MYLSVEAAPVVLPGVRNTDAQAASGMSQEWVPEPPPPLCFFCTVQMKHPWHDNGDEGPNLVDYFKSGANGTPVYYLEKNGFQ